MIILLIYKFYRYKIRKIGRNKFILCSVPPAVQGKSTALAVNVPVAAKSHLVFFQQLKYFRAFISDIDWRIVQEH